MVDHIPVDFLGLCEQVKHLEKGIFKVDLVDAAQFLSGATRIGPAGSVKTDWMGSSCDDGASSVIRCDMMCHLVVYM